MSVVSALLLTLAVAPPVQHIVIDAPLVLTASAPASGVETVLVSWVALRGGGVLDLSPSVGSGLGIGGDVALWAGGFESEGTAEVHATRFFAVAEARGLASWRAFSTTHAALTPYLFAGLRGGGGPSFITVFDDGRTSLLALWGARAGLGLDLTIHHVLVRSELGAGARDGRFELSSGVSLGAVF
jgi:hypothetical protein